MQFLHRFKFLALKKGGAFVDYKTVRAESQDEFVERKSRFIGYIAPVKTEKEAQDFIAKISKQHFDATHNVYAYVLRDGMTRRYSDNGEPQGTAGVPVLDVLLKEGLTDVCVVVTRYFGGIMLGAGGLVRAYSHGAKIAVDSAQILNMTICKKIEIECEYPFYGKLSYILPDYNIKTLSTDFSDRVKLTLLIRGDRLQGFSKNLTELSNGQVSFLELCELYEDMK